MIKKLHKYPIGSQVQRKPGHVYEKGEDGKWHPRGRVVMGRELGRSLHDHERVFHKNGKPFDDAASNLVVIKFTGTMYAIDSSRPVYIPKEKP